METKSEVENYYLVQLNQRLEEACEDFSRSLEQYEGTLKLDLSNAETYLDDLYNRVNDASIAIDKAERDINEYLGDVV